MTDMPTGPTDANPTTRYDPPPVTPPPAAPTIGPATGTSPVPSPTPPSPPPTWERTGGDSGHTGAIVFGVILVAIGLWFFADQTLGLEMPNLRWSELWPLIIIALGGWIVLSSLRRSR